MAAMRALAMELSLDGACQAALDAVERVFGASSAWIMLLDGQGRTLRTLVFRGRGAGVYRDATIPLDRAALSTRVVRGREVVFVPDVKRENR